MLQRTLWSDQKRTMIALWEATVTKLMWIMAQTKDPQKIKAMFYTTINPDILFPIIRSRRSETNQSVSDQSVRTKGGKAMTIQGRA